MTKLVVDLSNYALEDLLAFDDIFLDFFNNFLKNPAFPIQLQYNRFLGVFEEVPDIQAAKSRQSTDLDGSIFSSQRRKLVVTDNMPKSIISQVSRANRANLASQVPLQSETTEDKLDEPRASSANDYDSVDLYGYEQNKLFDWVRQERLPLFFRTDFFRDFKLCRLLTRPLNDYMIDLGSSVASSQLIGGYSRQSPPDSNTLSTDEQEGRTTIAPAAALFSNSRSGNNEDFLTTEETATVTANDNEEIIDYGRFFNDQDEIERFNKSLMQRPGSRALSVPAFFPLALINRYTSSNLLLSNNRPQPQAQAREQNNRVKSNKSSNKLVSFDADGAATNLRRSENVDDLATMSEKENNPGTSYPWEAGKGNKKEVIKTIGFSIKKSAEGKIKEGDFDELNASFIIHDNNYNEYERQLYDLNGFLIDDENELNDDDERLRAKNTTMDDDLAETDISLYASINQYKLKFLGSVRGMHEFKEFLKSESPNSGYRLLKFWLECEFYRDSMQDYDEIENMATRNRLYRDLIERYVFHFAKKAHEKISAAYNSANGEESHRLTHSIFERIQYDVLRRLRAYWVPRFILSKLKQRGKPYGVNPLPPLTPDYSRQSTYLSGVAASNAPKLTPSTVASSHHSDDRILSARKPLNNQQKETLHMTVKKALEADKDSGGPFLKFISTNHPEKLPLILFWYDVCDFNNIQSNGYDKSSKLEHAKALYNSYLSSTARFNINMPEALSEAANQSLLNQQRNLSNPNVDFDSNIFQPIMELIVPELQDAWLAFIKDDILRYTRTRLSVLNPSDDEEEEENVDEQGKVRRRVRTSSKEPAWLANLPDPEVRVQSSQVRITRPWLQDLIDVLNGGGRPGEKRKKIPLTEEQRAERRRRALEMEIERRKALRAARRRARLARKLATQDGLLDQKMQEANEKSATRKGATFQTDRSSFFDKLFENKIMMQLFRKFMVDNGRRDILNRFNAYCESKHYTESNDETKKHAISNSLMKNYLDSKSKRNILPLNERLQTKLNQDLHGDRNKGGSSAAAHHRRPKTGFMSALMKEFRGSLEDQFQKFCFQTYQEHDLSAPEDFALLTQTELLVLMGDSYNPKNFDFDDEKGEGKQMPSKEDRTEFLKMLYEWSIGKSPEKFYAFYAHLSEHGQKDGMPFLEKDLMFCIDSIRLKEINGEDVIRQKAQIFLDLYLDSPVAPSLQIDVNHETHQRLSRAATRIAQGTHQPATELGIFDDTRSHLFKELLPYWAGFKFACTVDPVTGAVIYPLTKQERMLRERLEEFMQMRKPSASDFKLPTLMGSGSSRHGRATNTPAGGASSDRAKANLNIVFSIATGIRFKDTDREVKTSAPQTNQPPVRPPSILTGANNHNNHLRSNSIHNSDRRSSNVVNVK